MPRAELTKECNFSGFMQGGVLCAFSGRADGNMSLFYGDTSNALDNRKAFLEAQGINYQDLISAKQVHSSNIKEICEADRGRGALAYDNAIRDTDALITDRKNLPLAVFTADCLSLFLYDPKAPVIAVVHAGWRSSRENIAGKTVGRMRETFGSIAGNLSVGLGPAIRECCYAVGEEFADLFPEGLRKKGNQHYLDLAAINTKQLIGAGVKEENILDSGICTSCRNKEFFSFRREGDRCGRMMSVIMLKGQP